ncbi:CHY zinc finger protein [Microbacterium sp. EST19A]|uniref:CHY zinc finger protein n=1 Tax=Microbacterium sp. EST19A TaxID=2862681 RepID=UPI0027E1AE60|nr:CHY zinc finger protein [Microbacterium sp. EST19A]
MTDPQYRQRPRVRGAVVDEMTRCVHYRSPVDIVAIRFACCGEYYPCHLCHEEAAGHPARVWALGSRAEKAVLCGACGVELTITDYLGTIACPQCGAPFNERCALHAHLYFETDPQERS